MKSIVYQIPVLSLIILLSQLELPLGINFNQNNLTAEHGLGNNPLELNTHEVLLSKPIKKKPYTIVDKPTEYVKVPVVQGYNAHTVAFDFNLGDLEDVHDSNLPDDGLSSEELHLLRNSNDEDLTFSEVSVLTPRSVSSYVTPIPEISPNLTTTSSEIPVTNNTTDLVTLPEQIESTSVSNITASETSTTPQPTLSSASPHVFKILSKNKSKMKSGVEYTQKDEQQKTFGNHFNSISTFFSDAIENTTADALHSNANVFQLMVNLYDHFYWQPSHIRTKVSPACGVEILSYITALNGNYDWAQKAYDASGHYRGQLFFGNNKWLGQREFCFEVNHNQFENERKHFQFEFYVATIHIAAWVPTNLTVELQLGECLPKSCSIRDIEAILRLDPHAQMLSVASLPINNSSHINIKSVRTTIGHYCIWRDVKFILFIAFCITLAIVVLVATWYESELNRKYRLRQDVGPSKVDTKVGMHPDLNGKAFEIYQMTQINTTADNNNVDVEADSRKEVSKPEIKLSFNPVSKDDNGPKGDGDSVRQPCSDVNANHVEVSEEIMSRPLGLHQEILLCFALQKNAGTLLSVESKIENQTSCVHGLRVFSLLWTILVHTYLQIFTIGENRFKRVIVERELIYQFIGNATFSVDTFFFISGLLVTLLYLKHDTTKKKSATDTKGFFKKSLKEGFFVILYRYIRLTPAYMFAIQFNELSLRYSFDKSVFQPTVAIQTCSNYWWRNILYINNFFPLSQICMIWSWYMANDMQFYIMATFLLIFSTRYFKTTVLILSTFLVSSWGLSGLISIQYNYIHKVADPFESFNYLYDKPWQRVGPYIVGMIAGYVVHVKKIPPKISFRLNLLLWIASLGLLFVIIFGVWSGRLNIIATAFYVSIGHTAFGMGLIWIVLSCCWGLANPVNKVLSYPGLLPLSRLTYCTYLIHPVVMLLTSYQMEGTLHLNNLMIWTIFLGNAVISFAVAFCLSVLLEAPLVRLLKTIFKN